MMLNASTARTIAPPGESETHGASARNSLPSFRMAPQEGAGEPGQKAEDPAHADGGEDRRAGDAERDPDAEEDAREDVAAEAVGPEGVARARAAEDLGRVHRGRRVGRDEVGEQARADERREGQARTQEQRAPRGAAPARATGLTHGGASGRAPRRAGPRRGSAS